MLSKETKSLLRKVAAHIIAEPKRLNMSDWIVKKTKRQTKQIDGYARQVERYGFARCGTAACVAGWMVLLHDGRKEAAKVKEISHRAKELLGIGLYESSYLFTVDSWDEPYQTKYMAATSVEAKAKVAAAYIRYYAKTR